MRLLLDENMPPWCVDEARHRGHQVAWVRDLMPGAPDSEILERWRETGEVLATRDLRFANLCFSLVSLERLSSMVVLVRAERMTGVRRAWTRFLDVAERPSAAIIVVTADRVRFRRAQPGAQTP